MLVKNPPKHRRCSVGEDIHPGLASVRQADITVGTPTMRTLAVMVTTSHNRQHQTR
jgi:hypothetical protein